MNSSDNTPSCFLYSKWLYKKKTKTQPLSRNGFPNLFLFFFSFFRYLPPSSNHHRVNNPFESLSTKRNRGVAIYSFYDVGPQRKNTKINDWNVSDADLFSPGCVLSKWQAHTQKKKVSHRRAINYFPSTYFRVDTTILCYHFIFLCVCFLFTLTPTPFY